MKAVNSTSIGANGRRNVQKQPRTFNYGDSSSIWDPKRTMTEQLREEKERLFGKQAARVYGIDSPQLATSAASPPRRPPLGWLRRDEAAEALGVSTWTLDHWTHPIQLKYIVVKNRHKAYYYDPEVIKQIQQTEWYTKREGKKRVYGKTEEEKKEARRKYREENKDKIKAWNSMYKKKSYAADPEALKARQRAYRERNRDKVCEQQRARRRNAKLSKVNITESSNTIE